MTENYRVRGFSYLPVVVKNLLIINAIVYLADLTLLSFGIDLTDYLGLHHIQSSKYFPTQYLTYMFMHATDNFSHILFNMFALWMFGYALENYWGSKKFLFYYLFTGVGAGLIQNVVMSWESYHMLAQGVFAQQVGYFIENTSTVGASGAVFGILLAFGMTFPNTPVFVYFLLPIKAKWFVIIYGVVELFAGIQGGGNIAHFAHLGGMLFGIILILHWRRKDRNRTNFFQNRY